MTVRIAYFDCYQGISGDMVLGALIDAGAGLTQINSELAKLNLGDYQVEAEKISRYGLQATQVKIKPAVLDTKPRKFKDIKAMIEKSSIASSIKEKALQSFSRLAEAESKIHNVSIDNIHFHQVGQVDAIIDIVGSMVALELLSVKKVYASRIPLGYGVIKCHNGEYPNPAPATIEILKGVPLYSVDSDYELVTPTGAAILTTLTKDFGRLPLFKVEGIGYGAGGMEIPGKTNFLRVMVGEAQEAIGEAGLIQERLYVVGTEIDDLNPEIYSYLFEQAFERGALDVYIEQIIMKKNRPGVSLQILVDPERLSDMLQLVFQETSTFGVKVREVSRLCLKRQIEEIATKYGPVKVKIGFWGDKILKVTPEYESCKALAQKRRLSIKRVYDIAQRHIEEKYYHSSGPPDSGRERK